MVLNMESNCGSKREIRNKEENVEQGFSSGYIAGEIFAVVVGEILMTMFDVVKREKEMPALLKLNSTLLLFY